MRALWVAGAVVTSVVAVTAGVTATAQRKPAPAVTPWTESFAVKPADLSATGDNPYFSLRPGLVLTLEGRDEGKAVTLVVSVLDKIEVLGGIEARVVEERETANGALAEVSRNFFAVDVRTKDLYYLGEDVDEYKNGKVVGHEGAWRHGVAGATLGMMLPGTPRVGQRYYQERAPGIALDRAEVMSVTERVTVPAGTFDNCVKTRETTPLETGELSYKVYAPGVGMVKDGDLVLVSRVPAKS